MAAVVEWPVGVATRLLRTSFIFSHRMPAFERVKTSLMTLASCIYITNLLRDDFPYSFEHIFHFLLFLHLRIWKVYFGIILRPAYVG